MTKPICTRCAEPLVTPDTFCVWCREEQELEAVGTLVSLATVQSGSARVQRVDAIDTLRSLGYSDEQVLRAKDRAIDGRSVEEILGGLGSVGAGLEAVA